MESGIAAAASRMMRPRWPGPSCQIMMTAPAGAAMTAAVQNGVAAAFGPALKSQPREANGQHVALCKSQHHVSILSTIVTLHSCAAAGFTVAGRVAPRPIGSDRHAVRSGPVGVGVGAMMMMVQSNFQGPSHLLIFLLLPGLAAPGAPDEFDDHCPDAAVRPPDRNGHTTVCQAMVLFIMIIASPAASASPGPQCRSLRGYGNLFKIIRPRPTAGLLSGPQQPQCSHARVLFTTADRPGAARRGRAGLV